MTKFIMLKVPYRGMASKLVSVPAEYDDDDDIYDYLAETVIPELHDSPFDTLEESEFDFLSFDWAEV